MGSLSFNIFVNDLFYIDVKSEIANYTDDNHLCYETKCHDELQKVFENDVKSESGIFYFQQTTAIQKYHNV